jgi:hypothetical protein
MQIPVIRGSHVLWLYQISRYIGCGGLTNRIRFHCFGRKIAIAIIGRKSQMQSLFKRQARCGYICAVLDLGHRLFRTPSVPTTRGGFIACSYISITRLRLTSNYRLLQPLSFYLYGSYQVIDFQTGIIHHIQSCQPWRQHCYNGPSWIMKSLKPLHSPS